MEQTSWIRSLFGRTKEDMIAAGCLKRRGRAKQAPEEEKNPGKHASQRLRAVGAAHETNGQCSEKTKSPKIEGMYRTY